MSAPCRVFRQNAGRKWDERVSPLTTCFCAGAVGAWRVDRIEAVRGPGLPAAERIDIIDGPEAVARKDARWVLCGVRSHLRYTTAEEWSFVDREIDLRLTRLAG